MHHVVDEGDYFLQEFNFASSCGSKYAIRIVTKMILNNVLKASIDMLVALYFQIVLFSNSVITIIFYSSNIF